MPIDKDKLRRPLFIIAYILLVLVFCLETGIGWVVKPDREPSADSIAAVQKNFKHDPPDMDSIRRDMKRLQQANEAPGYAIPYLGFTDGILLLSMTWTLLALIISQQVQGRIQGIITLIVGLLIALASFLAIFATLAILGVMVSLFLATPFGTLAYFGIWGFFGVGSAKMILSFSMILKIAFVILLVLSNQRFLRVKSMMALVLTSLVLTFVSTFLIGFVPPFLASITDAIAGIVNAVAGLVWALFVAIFSIWSVVRAILINRTSQGEG